MAPKTLLIFCDGTGMDGALAPPTSGFNAQDSVEAAALQFSHALDDSSLKTQCLQGLEGTDIRTDETLPPLKSEKIDEDSFELTAQSLTGIEDVAGGNVQHATNVLRLSRSIKSLDANGNRQIVFYQSGVGSESTFKGDQITGTTAMQALGTAVASKIRDAYVFIAQNFDDGDEICLFGFSRGAYTARKLAGLIDRIGLLTRERLGFFFEIWLELVDDKTPHIPPDTRRPAIKCVGVWDTVGSVYKEINALNIVDTDLPKTVKVALHAISLQENRKKFLPTLWTIPEGGLEDNQVLKQVWFAGAHSDVGGGYERHELADISLYWMTGELTSLIDIDLEFLRTFAQVQPDPWGTSQPHNAYKETSVALRPIIGHETRLESNQIVQQSIFHESVRHSPQQLTSPDYMITMSIIQNTFGSGFEPQYLALNEFEQYCRDHWGRGLTISHGVESPGSVIRSTAHWVGKQTGVMPADVVVGGRMVIVDVYVARAPYLGAIYPGILIERRTDMLITHEGRVISIPEPLYELLVGQRTSWLSVSGTFSLSKLGGAIPVLGGRDADRETLFVAQAYFVRSSFGYTLCGKVKEGDIGRFAFEDEELASDNYRVLVFI